MAVTDPLKKMFSDMIDILGVDVIWTSVKSPTQHASVRVGFKTAGKDDSEIVNAYGSGTVILTAKAVDFSVPPQKFDVFAVAPGNYVISVGYKIVARGK